MVFFFLELSTLQSASKDSVMAAAKEFINFVNKSPSPFHGMYSDFVMMSN